MQEKLNIYERRERIIILELLQTLEAKTFFILEEIELWQNQRHIDFNHMLLFSLNEELFKERMLLVFKITRLNDFLRG